jgi:hypothetical protein
MYDINRDKFGDKNVSLTVTFLVTQKSTLKLTAEESYS